jgi:hypothetical protein
MSNTTQPERAIVMGHRERRMDIDVTTKEVGKFKLGDKVTATVTGEIYELTAKNPYGPPHVFDGEEERDIPPSVGLKISKVVIASAKKNAFTEMSEDDEKE